MDCSDDREIVSLPRRDLMSPRSDPEYLNCNRSLRLLRLMMERMDLALVEVILALSLPLTTLSIASSPATASLVDSTLALFAVDFEHQRKIKHGL